MRNKRYQEIPRSWETCNTKRHPEFPSGNRARYLFPSWLQAATGLQPAFSSWLQAVTGLQPAFLNCNQARSPAATRFFQFSQARHRAATSVSDLHPSEAPGFNQHCRAATRHSKRRLDAITSNLLPERYQGLPGCVQAATNVSQNSESNHVYSVREVDLLVFCEFISFRWLLTYCYFYRFICFWNLLIVIFIGLLVL